MSSAQTTIQAQVHSMFRSSLGNRSERQKRDDEAFMNALKDIKTLKASKGRLSMNASDLQEQVEQLHEAGKRLVFGGKSRNS